MDLAIQYHSWPLENSIKDLNNICKLKINCPIWPGVCISVCMDICAGRKDKENEQRFVTCEQTNM